MEADVGVVNLRCVHGTCRGARVVQALAGCGECCGLEILAYRTCVIFARYSDQCFPKSSKHKSLSLRQWLRES